MNQPGRVEGLPRLLVSKLLARQPAQLLVDQRQQLGSGSPVACFDALQQLRDFVHVTAPHLSYSPVLLGGTWVDRESAAPSKDERESQEQWPLVLAWRCGLAANPAPKRTGE